MIVNCTLILVAALTPATTADADTDKFWLQLDWML